MKIRSIVLAAAVAALSSCAGKVTETTEVTGTVAQEGITEVRVIIQDVIDTLVPVVDGKFAVSLPTDHAVVGHLEAGSSGVNFIPDGTPLKVTIGETVTVSSKYPKISAAEKMNAYHEAEKALMVEYSETQAGIYADTVMTPLEKNVKFEEYMEGFMERYTEHHIEAVKSNPENFVAIEALYNLRGQLEDSLTDSLINLLSSDIQETKYIKNIKASLDARLNTAEGKPFIDFTVNTVTGMTRSIPPQPKYREVKFSNYVGKGKYVLVDFWAPWCSPCKREIPNIRSVYEKYADKGLEVLSIAVWERQPVQVTIDTAAELGMDWFHINNAGSVPTEIYGIEGIPHLMLIGPDGTILKRGFHGLDGIESAIAEYLK